MPTNSCRLLTVVGCVNWVMASTLSGRGMIPLRVMRCPRKSRELRPNWHLETLIPTHAPEAAEIAGGGVACVL